MPFEGSEDVGRDAHGPATSLGLGRTEFEPAAHALCHALDVDPAVQEVYVPTLEAEHLP